MRLKMSGRTKLIIALAVLISLIVLLPVKNILLEPSVIGAAVTRVFVRGLQTNHSCNAVFLEGWNLISIPCLSPNTSVGYVLSSITGNYTSIHAYDQDNNTDLWKSYNPSMPSWVVQDLSEINEKDGYWISMKSLSSFYLSGTLSSPNTIPLIKGWNLISYPSSTSEEITSALSAIGDNYNIIWLYNATEQKYYYYSPSNESGTLAEMKPYQGYWINMSGDDDLIII